MKKLISLILIFTIILSSVVSVSAIEKISFEFNNVNTDKNRLFTVQMTAMCASPLSAATFEITYDNDLFEYRSTKTDAYSQISANETGGKLNVVYLNTYGKDISNGEVIFYMTFKAVKSGTGYIDFYASDCVNADVKSIEIGNCASAMITVNDKSDKDNNSQKHKNSKQDTSQSNDRKSETKEKETTLTSTYDELGLLNPINDSNTISLLVGICIGASIVIVIYIGFFTIIQYIKKNSKKNESSDVD